MIASLLQEEIARKAGYACGTLFVFALFAIPFVLCIRWARAAKSTGPRVVAILGAIVFGILLTGGILGTILRKTG
jgi:hypothetical protein